MSEQQQQQQGDGSAGGPEGGPGSKPGGMSLGFSIKGKARAKVAVNTEKEQEHRQLITAVAEDGTIQTAGPAPGAGGKQQYVVPALQNTYKTGVGKFVPSFVPEASTAAIKGDAEERFERAEVGHAPTLTTFGLEVRHRKDPAAEAAGAAAAAAGEGGGNAAAAAAPDRPLVPVVSRADEYAQLKEDLEQLPDEATVEDYESLPVEEFGKALLRGLGWSDGQGVGRKRQLVEPKQIIRRPERLGLGANPAAPPPEKRPRKMGEKPKQDLVAAPTADGRVRHRVGLDEALVPRASLAPGPQPGKVMEVVGGRHEGLRCAVKELLGGSGPTARVLVELKPSGEVVEVTAADLAERGSTRAAAAAAGAGDSSGRWQQQEQRADGSSGGRGREGREEREQGSRDRDRDRQRSEDPSREQREREREHGSRSSRGAAEGRDRDRDRERDRDRDRDRERERSKGDRGDRDRQQRHREEDNRNRHGGGSSSRRPQQQQPQVLPLHKLWVASLIRVRVVDKRVGGGKLYLKKGTVMDVRPDGGCDVRLEEEGRGVVTIHQDQLETVVPKDPGAAVMVVAGEHRGRKGRLLQASSSSGAAALQLLGDMQVVRLMLDDVAQFMGHLDDEDE